MRAAIAARCFVALDDAARKLGDDDEGAGLRLARRLGVSGFIERETGRPDAGGSNAEHILRRLGNQVLLDAAAEISAELSRGGVRHFFLKGVALLGRFYCLGDREMADIDLFLHPDDLARGLQALSALGYEAYPDREQPSPPSMTPGLSMYRAGDRHEVEGVDLDVRWGIEPIDRLLARADLTLPGEVWESVEHRGSLTVPCDEHHAVLLVHHLMRHDLIHARGLVDLAFLWSEWGAGIQPRRFATLADHLRLERLSGLLASVLADDFGVNAARQWTGERAWWGTRRVTLTALLMLAGSADEREAAMITPTRFLRRFMLSDRLGAGLSLARDALFPPKDYLRWRWPDDGSAFTAWLSHVRRLFGKLMWQRTLVLLPVAGRAILGT